MMTHDEDYLTVKTERFGPVSDNLADDLRAARQEIDRLDAEVARLEQTQQAIWDTLTSRAAKLSNLSVILDRIDYMHSPDGGGDPDRPPWCQECGHTYPCRTAEKIRRG